MTLSHVFYLFFYVIYTLHTKHFILWTLSGLGSNDGASMWHHAAVSQHLVQYRGALHTERKLDVS